MDRACGVVLSEDQQYLLEARLGPVSARAGYPSIDLYVAAACAPGAPKALSKTIIDAMTTHESYFFRDASFWKSLEEVVLPRLIAERRHGPLQIWSAAASHGQEAYSLAMLLEERWPDVAATTTILATDVAELAVDRGRSAVYSALEVNRGLSAARLVRHFDKEPGGFRVKDALRKRISWGVHNLLDPALPGNFFDIVLCRNVLIYFSEANKKTVLRRLFEATRQTGFVALGSTEQASRAPLFPGWYSNSALPQTRHP